MPRKAGGHNNPSHKRARKRSRQQLSQEMRYVRFNTMAEQNGLEFESHGSNMGFRARRDPYEWAIAHAEANGVIFPHMLLMGSAMGWLYEAILGYEAGEELRKTSRQDAEDKYEDLLQDAAMRGLHQWIPQPVPDDFVCPYTGVSADKRKILATGVRYDRIDGATPAEKESYVYAGHESYVVYRAEHRGGWYIAREIWDGSRDSDGNRLGVKIEKLPFGEAKIQRQLGADAPGLPFRGVKGYSGQPGRPASRDQSDRPPRPAPLGDNVVYKTTKGYDVEIEARKQAMIHIFSLFVGKDSDGSPIPAAVMGMQHVNLRRASRMRGGARRASHVLASPPASDVLGQRHAITIPAHLWSGVIVDDPKAPRAIKTRRIRKKPEDSEDIRSTVKSWRNKALKDSDEVRIQSTDSV